LLTVSDTGIGIPEAEHQNIFKEYHQLNNDARDRQKGVGLGLAVVWRMCALLDITINLKSALGEGSSFTLSIPLGKPEEIIHNEQSASSAAASEALSVIVVDDEIPILEAMSSLLEQWGCQCHAYSNLENALQAIEEKNISADIIISDYRLTDRLTGIECIEQLRQALGDEIPAVLLSGDTDPNLLNQVQSAGFYMLHKPLKPNKLRNVMSILAQNGEANS